MIEHAEPTTRDAESASLGAQFLGPIGGAGTQGDEFLAERVPVSDEKRAELSRMCQRYMEHMSTRHHLIAALVDAGCLEEEAESISYEIFAPPLPDPKDWKRIGLQKQRDKYQRKLERSRRILAAIDAITGEP